ncbi:hypothetical protein Btru_019280 [Bulinus truncatus]|nr:hypothetical protein Btru_019280 [Bulinus truncatus]
MRKQLKDFGFSFDWDRTVLAHEQIDGNGCSWRSGAKSGRRNISPSGISFIGTQPFHRVLLQGLEEVDPDLWKDIIDIQRNWISSLVKVIALISKSNWRDKDELPLSVYTEDLDLIYGVSYVCVKPSHHLCVDFNITDPGAVLPVYAVHPFTGEHLKLIVTDERFMYPNRDVKLAVIPCINEHDKAAAEKLNIPYKSVFGS